MKDFLHHLMLKAEIFNRELLLLVLKPHQDHSNHLGSKLSKLHLTPEILCLQFIPATAYFLKLSYYFNA